MSAHRKLNASHGAWLLGWLLLFSFTAHGQDNLHFHGALVAKPCLATPENERNEVRMGAIQLQELYDNSRSAGTEFTLRLGQCDTAMAHAVNVTFIGNQSSLWGLLDIAPDSQADNIAIGLETLEGEAVMINQSVQRQLVDGDNLLRFRAYVQAKGSYPYVIINPGTFRAVADIELSYE